MIVSMFERIVLGIAGVTAFTIGGFIALEPHTFYLSYGIALADDPNLLIEPLGLSVQCDALLLLFRLSGQHTIRTLALPLIDEASVSTFSFTYPTDFNLERFMREHDGVSAS